MKNNLSFWVILSLCTLSAISAGAQMVKFDPVSDHPDPALTITRTPYLSPNPVGTSKSVSGDFDWNIYSGDTQPGNPVWVCVYGWRDSNGSFASGTQVKVFYHDIPGTYPGHTGTSQPISIPAPSAAGTYTLWADAYPTTSDSTAVQMFKNYNGSVDIAHKTLDSIRVSDHLDPAMTITRRPRLTPNPVAPDGTVTGYFDWNIYSGDNQPDSPVWVCVYGWRKNNGSWVSGTSVIVFYHDIPGTYPGYTGTNQAISIKAPSETGSYTLWADAYPTTSDSTANQMFKDYSGSTDIVHKRLNSVTVRH